MPRAFLKAREPFSSYSHFIGAVLSGAGLFVLLVRLLFDSSVTGSLAAAAVVASTGLEAFVYDSVREIIHLCGGTLEKEDALREFMLERVKDCLNGFSEAFEYDVELEARLDGEAEKEASRGDALIEEADA